MSGGSCQEQRLHVGGYQPLGTPLLSASPPQPSQLPRALSAAVRVTQHMFPGPRAHQCMDPPWPPFFLRDQDLRGTMSPRSVHPDTLRDKLPKQLVWTHTAQRERSFSFSVLLTTHDAHLDVCQVYIPHETVLNTHPVNYLCFARKLMLILCNF